MREPYLKEYPIIVELLVNIHPLHFEKYFFAFLLLLFNNFIVLSTHFEVFI